MLLQVLVSSRTLLSSSPLALYSTRPASLLLPRHPPHTPTLTSYYYPLLVLRLLILLIFLILLILKSLGADTQVSLLVLALS